MQRYARERPGSDFGASSQWLRRSRDTSPEQCAPAPVIVRPRLNDRPALLDFDRPAARHWCMSVTDPSAAVKDLLAILDSKPSR